MVKSSFIEKTKSTTTIIIGIIALLALLLSGCSSDVSQELSVPQPTPTVQTTAGPSPTPTATPSPTPTPIPTPEPVAEGISEGFKISINGMDVIPILSDCDIYSRTYINSDRTLLIESEQPFSALYIEWWVAPEGCLMVWDNGSKAFNSQSFLHEYIRLPEAVSSISIISDEDSTNTISSLELYTEGRSPDTVQNWQPPLEKADILVFPTHSDDDTLFFGPLISHYAIEEELKVQTAFMVEHIISPQRSHERLDGLWEMGIRNYPILGTATDTGVYEFQIAMNIYAPYNIDQWQTEQIRRFRPLVVVGHDLDGEYGNGGHKVNAYYLTQTIEAAADPQQFPESAELYGVWDCPKLYLHLYEENQIVIDVNTPLENDPEGRTAFQIAGDAFRYHLSQQGHHYAVAQEENPQFDCRLYGLYRSLVGPDTKADIMDNISDEYFR